MKKVGRRLSKPECELLLSLLDTAPVSKATTRLRRKLLRRVGRPLPEDAAPSGAPDPRQTSLFEG